MNATGSVSREGFFRGFDDCLRPLKFFFAHDGRVAVRNDDPRRPIFLNRRYSANARGFTFSGDVGSHILLIGENTPYLTGRPIILRCDIPALVHIFIFPRSEAAVGKQLVADLRRSPAVERHFKNLADDCGSRRVRLPSAAVILTIAINRPAYDVISISHQGVLGAFYLLGQVAAIIFIHHKLESNVDAANTVYVIV